MIDDYESLRQKLIVSDESNTKLQKRVRELEEENARCVKAIEEIYELVMLLKLLQEIEDMCKNGN